MKKKMAVRLTFYFTIVLLSFALISGVVFTGLFSSNTTRIYKEQMETNAKKVAATMAGFYSDDSFLPQHGHEQCGGFGAYLRYINDVSISNVWIVDRDSNQITCNMDFMASELPENAAGVIETAYLGETVTSEEFSDFLGEKSITTATPIILDNGEIVGAVLVHSAAKNISDPIYNGFLFLGIGILIALIIVVLLAFVLSYSFTKPLLKIKDTALVLADGNYQSKTNIKSTDEVGQLADAVDILSGRLYAASLESMKLEKMRQDFVSTISHELRTPVTVIRGSLEAMHDGMVDEDRKAEYVDAILSESIYLERLINDLLELSRLQNTDFAIEKSKINFCDVITETVRSIHRIADKKNISIILERDIEAMPMSGDYGRLRQMVMIVLDNAVKFTEPGEKIMVRLQSENGKTILSVEDKGVGIDKDILPFIFDRFHRTIDVNNKNGTGLGLAIAKQIALRHDIDIEASSEPNVGTVFRFVINDKEYVKTS